jgi:hypothetical protein
MTIECNNITIEPYESKLLFVEAARYAFGRATYASSETAKIVKAHLNELPPDVCCIIAKDIRDGIKDYKHTCRPKTFYDMDVKPWEDLLPELDARGKLYYQ